MDDWGGPWKREQEEKAEIRRGIVVFALITVAVVVLVFIGLLAKIVFFPTYVAEQSIDTAYEVVDKVMDSDKAIADYEWFKSQEAYIRQCLRNEEIAKEEWDIFKAELPEDRDKWDRDDKTEEASLRNSYYALQKLTNKAMEDYNARSSMTTRSVFKDNLPSNIDRAFYAGKKLTE